MVSLVPVAPIGCPRAMAPPLTLTFSMSIPRSLMTARVWEAKASFSSTRSMSSRRSPVSSSSLGMATVGPIPLHDHHRGRAVAALGGVAGGDGAALLEDGLELRQGLDGGVPARPLVAGEGGLQVLWPAVVVQLVQPDGEGDDLGVEKAGVDGLGRTL